MITVTGTATVGYVVLAGAIDEADATDLKGVAAEMVEAGVTDLTIDLSRVTFLGTDGLDALTATEHLFEGTGRMVLTGATIACRRVFDIACLDRAYHIIPAALGRRSLGQRGLAAGSDRRPDPRPPTEAGSRWRGPSSRHRR